MAELREHGFVVKLQGKDYITVAGSVYLAHHSNLLVSTEVNVQLSEDGEWIEAVAVGQVYNEAIVNKIATNDNILDSTKEKLIERAAFGTFVGNARSHTTEGKQAERTNPWEVAATSAIGRMLRAAGYGEMESFASADEVAVAVSRGGGISSSSNKTTSPASTGDKPTPAQINFLKKLTKAKTDKALEIAAMTKFGRETSELSKRDISNWIDELNTAEAQEKPKPGF